MSRSHLGICCAAIILLAARAALPAQTLPAFDQFDGDLRACAAGQNIALSADLSASIRQIYNGPTGTSIELCRLHDVLIANTGKRST